MRVTACITNGSFKDSSTPFRRKYACYNLNDIFIMAVSKLRKKSFQMLPWPCSSPWLTNSCLCIWSLLVTWHGTGTLVSFTQLPFSRPFLCCITLFLHSLVWEEHDICSVLIATFISSDCMLLKTVHSSCLHAVITCSSCLVRLIFPQTFNLL